MTCSHLSQAHQTDINTKTPRPISDLWLVQPSQYWPMIGWHWPQSDPCHCYWYQGPVSLHNGGCIVTSEAWHLIIIGASKSTLTQRIEDYSDHWASGAMEFRSAHSRGSIALHWLSLFGFVLRKAGMGRKQKWMSRGSGLVTCEGNGQGDDSPDYHGQGKWRPLVASSGDWLGTAPSFQANSFSQDCCVITSEVRRDIRHRASSAGTQWSVTRSYSNTSMPHQ